MATINFYRIIIVLGITCFSGVVTYARGVPEIITQKGINAYKKGNYEKAIEDFGTAVLKRPQTPALSYNAGVSAYRADDLKTASEYLETNTTVEIDSNIAASTYFTLGNIQFKSANSIKESDPFQAISTLELGIDYFERSLKLDFNENVAINLELARNMLKEIRDENPPQNSENEEPDDSNNNDNKESEQNSEKDKDNSLAKTNQEDEENNNLESPEEEKKSGGITPQDLIQQEEEDADRRAENIIKVMPVAQDW